MRGAVAAAALLVALIATGVDAQAPDPVILAAGDIAGCDTNGDSDTSDLLDTLDGTILLLGDLAYPDGTAGQFTNCYHPTWGRHIARTMPSPGNHEYHTAGATGYYGYFGAAAGDPTKGYYSFDLGEWHIIALNSNSSCVAVPCGAGSVQEQWLRQDLQASSAKCTLAYWHHPRFNSGASHGNSSGMSALWDALYEYGADVVLNGHEHTYERFAKQRPDQAADPAHGIREFVVGTGGRSHYTFGTIQPNSQVREGDTYGVLQMTLHEDSYGWQFMPIVGETFTDSGVDTCHNAAGVGGNTLLPDPDDTDGIAMQVVIVGGVVLALGVAGSVLFARRRMRV